MLVQIKNAHRHILSCYSSPKITWGQIQLLSFASSKLSSGVKTLLTVNKFSLHFSWSPLSPRETLSVAKGPCRADVPPTCCINTNSVSFASPLLHHLPPVSQSLLEALDSQSRWCVPEAFTHTYFCPSAMKREAVMWRILWHLALKSRTDMAAKS